ncbi:MAG: hypothetical protein ABSB88_11895 [Bryobacteraceae bacterium]|jgi:hypothetical protein
MASDAAPRDRLWAAILQTAPPAPPTSLTPRSQLLAEKYAVIALAGAAAERAFWPLLGLYRVACHEAAHAVAGYVLSEDPPSSYISILPPDGQTLGYVLSGAKDFASSIRVPTRTYVTSDERQALLTLRLGLPSADWRKIRAYMRICRRRASELVGENSVLITALANHLLKMKTVDGAAEIRAILEGARRTQALERLRQLGVNRAGN